MKQKQFRTKGKQREVEEKEKEQIEKKVLKNREIEKKKGLYGGGDNPAHKVYNVVCFFIFCYNNREKGIDSRFRKKSNFDLYN